MLTLREQRDRLLAALEKCEQALVGFLNQCDTQEIAASFQEFSTAQREARALIAECRAAMAKPECPHADLQYAFVAGCRRWLCRTCGELLDEPTEPGDPDTAAVSWQEREKERKRPFDCHCKPTGICRPCWDADFGTINNYKPPRSRRGP